MSLRIISNALKWIYDLSCFDAYARANSGFSLFFLGLFFISIHTQKICALCKVHILNTMHFSHISGTQRRQWHNAITIWQFFHLSYTHPLADFFCVILFGRVCFARVEARNSIKYELLGNAWEQRWSMRTKNAGKSRILLITFLFASAGKNANTIIQILSFSAAKFNFYFKPERERGRKRTKKRENHGIYFLLLKQPTNG